MHIQSWLILLGAVAAYLARCAINPYTRCRSCRGIGRKTNGRNWRPCWLCKQTGSRRRWGARLLGRGE